MQVVHLEEHEVDKHDTGAVKGLPGGPEAKYAASVVHRGRGLFSKDDTEDEEKPALVETVEDPFPEDKRAELLVLHSHLVKLGVVDEVFFGVLEVEECVKHDWESGESDVVELIDPWLVQSLSREDRPEAEEVLGDHVHHVLVEGVADELSVSTVALPAVDKQKRFQEFELADGEVTRAGGLHTFTPSNTDTDMSFHDHGHIVSSITNGKSCLVGEPHADHFHDVSLLLWRDTAPEHHITQVGNVKQLSFHGRGRLNFDQTFTGDHQGNLGASACQL